jgi:tryptophan halogenase
MNKLIKPIKSITIVGGGTSAWLTAAYLSSSCSIDTSITVVDKFNGESVGVGEATLVPFLSFLENCGLPEKMWFDAIDTTVKGGILFENWQNDGEDIWHPFSHYLFDGRHDNGISFWSNNQNLSFVEYALPEYELFVNSKKINETNVKSVARHIDCTKLVKFIKNYLSDKIFFINSEVVEVVKDDIGNIKKILLKNNQQIKSDLYIDCTGFKKILSQENKKILLTDRLFCDTAVAGHIPYKDRKNELHPYTASDAVEHGWIWKIPVKSRIGSGLVFNRSITDPEEAKDYFVKYWDNRVERESLKVIDWTPYYSEKFWSNNVVSIGLSGGFIEPLESTGLQFIQNGIEYLEKVIKNSFYVPEDVELYNIKMKYAYDETVDYINMHYCNSNKNGKFWDFVRENTSCLSERMKYYLNLINKNNYIEMDCGETIFSNYSWILWLIQLGYPIANLKTSFSNYDMLRSLKNNYESCLRSVDDSLDADTFCDLYSKII